MSRPLLVKVALMIEACSCVVIKESGLCFVLQRSLSRTSSNQNERFANVSGIYLEKRAELAALTLQSTVVDLILLPWSLSVEVAPAVDPWLVQRCNPSEVCARRMLLSLVLALPSETQAPIPGRVWAYLRF